MSEEEAGKSVPLAGLAGGMIGLVAEGGIHYAVEVGICFAAVVDNFVGSSKK